MAVSIELMEKAHRKTAHPARAARGGEYAHAGQGKEKTISWWDGPSTNTYALETKEHKPIGNRTKSSMVSRPKCGRAPHTPVTTIRTHMENDPGSTQVAHGPKTKTEPFMSLYQSFMANGTFSSNIQQRDKNIPICTAMSSRNGVYENIKRLSFLV